MSNTSIADGALAASGMLGEVRRSLRSALAALSGWHTEQRLYTLQSPAQGGDQGSARVADLLVESFVLAEDVSQPFVLLVNALTLDVGVALKDLYARPITLVTRLADGSEARRSGYVTEALSLESDGGFARKGLVVRPWLALLAHTHHSWSWQDKSTIEIVEEVFADHAAIAAWRWDVDVAAHVAQGLFARNGGKRAYCNQYRESDFDFVQRLLAEEGIAWRVDEDAQAPGGHTVVFFVSSASQPQDATSVAGSSAGPGIRFHRGDSQEATDAIQALGALRQVGPTATTVLGWDYKANTAIVGDAPTHHAWGGPEASSLQAWLHSYDPTGCHLFGSAAEAQFCATRLQEAREARLKTWLGRGTVRTLRAGTWAAVSQSTIDTLADVLADGGDDASANPNTRSNEREFFVTHVHAVGINNLPKELNADIAARLGVDLAQALAQMAAELPHAMQPGSSALHSTLHTGLHSTLQDSTHGGPLAVRPAHTSAWALSHEGADGWSDGLDDAWSDDWADGSHSMAHGVPQQQVGLSPDTQALIEQAQASGFAQQFQAVRRSVPWRPVLMDDTGLRPRPRPTALGLQTAIVVGPDGSSTPQGADELYTDALGRVRVQFHWQTNAPPSARTRSQSSCWLRVMQAQTGSGMGHQHLPRIGQEVLVGFAGNDIDRPVVLRALYNGRGEAGVAHTPGGQAGASDTRALAESTDHRPSAQMNLVEAGAGAGPGGHSPAWHGGAPGAASPGSPGQNNAAALSGIKSKEFGGRGHNQLVFDDTPGQLRLHLHSTQAQTWLSMGHLLHQADNHRGSLRGLGFELRTDAWGGVRAVRGLMLSTYALRPGPGQTPEPAGDNAAGIALAKQLVSLAQSFDQAAATHQTVRVAAAAGTQGPSQSAIDPSLSPAPALLKSLRGMVSTTSLPQATADAARKTTATADASVPHMADPHIALVGQAGVGITVGQHLHLASDDATTLASGQDTHWAVGGQARIHTGQAIGVLGGAIQAQGAPGSEAAGQGLSLIAAQGPIELQAQAGPAQVAAKDALSIQTSQGVINLAAAKKVVLATAGGARITIEGGQFTAECPGTITVQAGSKSMVGAGTYAQAMNAMPGPAKFDDAYLVRNPATGEPLRNVSVEITRGDGTKLRTLTDAAGRTPLQKSDLFESVSVRILD